MHVLPKTKIVKVYLHLFFGWFYWHKKRTPKIFNALKRSANFTCELSRITLNASRIRGFCPVSSCCDRKTASEVNFCCLFLSSLTSATPNRQPWINHNNWRKNVSYIWPFSLKIRNEACYIMEKQYKINYFA